MSELTTQDNTEHSNQTKNSHLESTSSTGTKSPIVNIRNKHVRNLGIGFIAGGFAGALTQILYLFAFGISTSEFGSLFGSLFGLIFQNILRDGVVGAIFGWIVGLPFKSYWPSIIGGLIGGLCLFVPTIAITIFMRAAGG